LTHSEHREIATSLVPSEVPSKVATEPSFDEITRRSRQPSYVSYTVERTSGCTENNKHNDRDHNCPESLVFEHLNSPEIF
jgi:hypothetical protein